jgi:hypothetical protein
MNGSTRRKLEMGTRALEFSEAHPDESDGYRAALADLKQQVARAAQLADQQRDGTIEVRAATARKRDLHRNMRRRMLVHVTRAGRRAAREIPELGPKFTMPEDGIPYLAFLTIARTMATAARQHQELLVKHGLVERVLKSLEDAIAQFEQAVAQGSEGRRLHIGARANLDVVASDIVEIVSVIDGVNRVRFAGGPDLLAGWRSASNVLPSPQVAKSPEKPAGEVKPAA